MKLILHRIDPRELPASTDLSNRTFGVMQLGRKSIQTIERQWVPGDYGVGAPNVSCVAAGHYDLVWRQSPAKGNRIHLVAPELGVFLEADDREHPWQRFSCMFHTANFWRNIEGCIGPGAALHDFGGKHGWGVTSSEATLARIEEHVSTWRITELEIRD